MNELLEQFREQYPQYADMDDETLAKALHKRFYADMSFEEFENRIGGVQRTQPIPRSEVPPGQASIGPAGPMAQPPFAGLSPRVGGALDALVTYGNSLMMGLPGMVSDNVNAVTTDAQERNPRMAALMAAAGGATTGAATGLGAMRGAFGRRIARATSPTGFAVTGPNIAQRAGGALASAGRGGLDLIRSRLARYGGGVGLGYYLLNRLNGGGQQ